MDSSRRQESSRRQTDAIPKSIVKIEKHRDMLTQCTIKGTLHKKRVFNIANKIKVQKIDTLDEKYRELHSFMRQRCRRICLRDFVPDFDPDFLPKTYDFGGFSTDED